MFAIIGLLTLWWYREITKEETKHKEVMCEYQAMEKRLVSIECKYFALTGTDIRQTFTEAEVYQAFDELMKKYPAYLKKRDPHLSA
jgi:hypothetical protein